MRFRPAAAAITGAIVAVALLPGRAQQGPAPASQAPPGTVIETLEWRSIGPDRGGRSIAVSGVKGRPREAYFGAVGGGLWKTTDGGENWMPVTDGQIKSASVGAVAVSESNRMSSSSGWASRASAATSCPATASTSRPTRERPG